MLLETVSVLGIILANVVCYACHDKSVLRFKLKGPRILFISNRKAPRSKRSNCNSFSQPCCLAWPIVPTPLRLPCRSAASASKHPTQYWALDVLEPHHLVRLPWHSSRVCLDRKFSVKLGRERSANDLLHLVLHSDWHHPCRYHRSF